jgi:hypothetical protein
MKVTEIIRAKVWTFEVWGWGNGTVLITCMYAPSRASHADAMRVRTWGDRDSPQSGRYHSALRDIFIKPMDKSGEQYKRHVALLKILETATGRYTNCPMKEKLCRSDMAVLNTKRITNSYISISTMIVRGTLLMVQLVEAQTGRSRVRFPMVSSEFFINIILPPWG